MPSTALKLINESIATDQYQLKKHLYDLFNGWQYERYLQDYIFLIAEGDCEIDGHLHLDYGNSTWATNALQWREQMHIAGDEHTDQNYGIRGLIVTGNLTVRGSIINSNMNDGPFLLVMGNVSAHNVVAGGGYMEIKGNATISGVSYGNYNDGSIHIKGALETAVFINNDHDFAYGELKNAQYWFNTHDDKSPVLRESADGGYLIPKKLRPLLGGDIANWDDILDSLCKGNEVLQATGAKTTQKDTNYWLNQLKKDGMQLIKVPKAERTPALCLAAVVQEGWALQYVPKELITPELCEIALQKEGHTIQYVPPKLKTKSICQLAVQNGASLSDIPPKLIDYDMAYAAIGSYSALNYIPPNLIDKPLLVKYMQLAGRDGDNLQYFFKTPQAYTAEEVVLEAVPTSFEVFAEMPAMYVTSKVFELAKSLYQTHKDWPALCEAKSRAQYGGDLSDKEIAGLIGKEFRYGAAENKDEVLRELEGALEHVWAYQVDSAYILKLMHICNDFQGVANIPHHLMSDKIVSAMLSASTTHIQYLPHHLITEEMCIDVVSEWHTSLSCIPPSFRNLAVCQAALKRCKTEGDYLLDEVLAEIPAKIRKALNV